MQAESKDFFLKSIDLMRSLDPDQRPIWGEMGPQHMVEHIVGSWRISNGRARVQTVLQEDELADRREFLFSDREYEKNIANPVLGGKTPTLRKPSLDAAIDQLEDEMNAFFTFHDAHPDVIETHPVFGDLDYEGWLIFQSKHMKHNLHQFDLI